MAEIVSDSVVSPNDFHQRVVMTQDQMAVSLHYQYDVTTKWAALLRKADCEWRDDRT